MPTLYLTEQGAVVRKEQNRLLVESGGKVVSEIHEFKIDRVVIFGHVQLTTQVVSYLLNRGIDTAFLSIQGQLKGRLASLASKNVLLRLRQYEMARNSEFALKIARAIVEGKIANCIELLDRYQRNHQDCDHKDELASLGCLREEVERKQTMESLRGVERRAAAIYFQAFGRMLRGQLQFTKRTRRPPTDPINAMLSFGYVLLYNEAIAALVSIGFDPYLGFYHGISYGRCSLALDLIEEFRHLTVDRLVSRIANLKILGPADFTEGEGGGVYLSPEARKRFLSEYETMMNGEFAHHQTGTRISLRRALHEQSLQFERALLGSAEYEAFRGWH